MNDRKKQEHLGPFQICAEGGLRGVNVFLGDSLAFVNSCFLHPYLCYCTEQSGMGPEARSKRKALLCALSALPFVGT